ncbi:beta-ketoacyl synthase N-terminal-like domain-containing protein [Streptomyces sp. NPDC040750]|uniref:beta-ketoacyl synthase N-terminal-like domain-containing protein n=1 Tax=Streptomyces sp. NPDC040750 TaxID=3154491 RepID=UPI0033F655BE
MSSSVDPARGVAVIGLACRVPGAGDIDTFWRNLLDGETRLERLDHKALRALGVPEERLRDENFVPVAGRVPDTDHFDAAYFGVAPAEAALMDPQHRVFLEEAVHALEHAGYGNPDRGTSIGVFCGTSANDYAAARSGTSASRLTDQPASLPLRVSHSLDLRGPSYFVNTLCSTGLSAVHLARAGLLAGECEIALAGAVSLGLPRDHGYVVAPGGVLSPDGVCRPFDEDASGTVPGGGVGVVVLKRLDAALRDGDTVHAVIRGSAVNNDGADKMSFAAPSVTGQREVILAGLRDAGVSPETVGFVEAHGTGTPLGDPVELAALAEARRELAKAPLPGCAVGSVKSTIGHLDAAAGVIGFLKAVLAVRHGVIPPTAAHQRLSAEVGLDGTGLFVPRTVQSWPIAGPRRAGVTALGMGGTNVHIVLEEAPAVEQSEDSGEAEIYPLSARSDWSHRAAFGPLRRALNGLEENGSMVAATLQSGRAHHELRTAFVCDSLSELAASLEAAEASGLAPVQGDGLVLRVGAEPSAVRPAADLLGRIPAFDAAWDWTSEDELSGQEAEAAFRTGVGLLGALLHLGIEPVEVAASGLGEFAAAVALGALPFADALQAVRLWARASADVESGRFGTVPEHLRRISDLLNGVAMTPVDLPLRSEADGSYTAAGEILPAGRLIAAAEYALLGDPVGGGTQVDLGQFDGSWRGLLALIARAWERGATVDWPALRQGRQVRKVPLPGYRFEPASHWALPAGPPDTADTKAAATGGPVAEQQASLSAASTDYLGTVAAIWSEVLGVETPQAEDNFFDLGGHSLLASQVLARLRQYYGIEIPLGELLDLETLAETSELVRSRHERVSAGERHEDAEWEEITL